MKDNKSVCFWVLIHVENFLHSKLVGPIHARYTVARGRYS